MRKALKKEYVWQTHELFTDREVLDDDDELKYPDKFFYDIRKAEEYLKNIAIDYLNCPEEYLVFMDGDDNGEVLLFCRSPEPINNDGSDYDDIFEVYWQNIGIIHFHKIEDYNE